MRVLRCKWCRLWSFHGNGSSFLEMDGRDYVRLSYNMRTGLRNMPLVLLTIATSTKVSRSKGKSLPRMAPNLAESQHAQIRDMRFELLVQAPLESALAAAIEALLAPILVVHAGRCGISAIEAIYSV